MASRSVLHRAKKLLRARRFSAVIKLLQERKYDFPESFDYYYVIGTACMYIGDIGSADRYFQAARKISMLDTRLLVAQAALFLRRGDTGHALEYYLDIQENDPGNKIARDALEFIRLHGAPEEIADWVASGRIKKFYPPLGVHPAVPGICAFLAICLIGGAGGLFFWRYRESLKPPPRADLSAFVLSVDERNNALQEDLSGGVYRYILTSRQINESYDAAREYFQDYRDNAAQVEINRILNSNASAVIRHTATLLQSYLKEPTFDTVTDSFSYEQIAADPYLYENCWVVWSGRVANAQATETAYSCDLLVGYEDQKRVDGIVPLKFNSAMNIDAQLPLRVLGQLCISDGKIWLNGKSVYQPLTGGKL